MDHWWRALRINFKLLKNYLYLPCSTSTKEDWWVEQGGKAMRSRYSCPLIFSKSFICLNWNETRQTIERKLLISPFRLSRITRIIWKKKYWIYLVVFASDILFVCYKNYFSQKLLCQIQIIRNEFIVFFNNNQIMEGSVVLMKKYRLL